MYQETNIQYAPRNGHRDSLAGDVQAEAWSGWRGLTPILRYANFYDGGPDEGFGPRYIQDFQVLFVRAGRGVAEIDGRRIEFSAGDLLFYGPNRCHKVVSGPDGPLRLIGLHFLFCEDDLGRLDLSAGWASPRPFSFEFRPPRCPLSPPPAAYATPGVSSPARQACEALVISYLAAPSGRPLEKRGLLLQLIENWYEVMLRERRQAPLAVPHRRAVEEAERLLLSSLDHPPALEELGRGANLSADYFNRLFKRQTGYTVRGFVTEQRLLNARRLLIEGKLNVTEVARSVGYDDPYHFSRRFVRRFGIAPSTFRKDQRMI